MDPDREMDMKVAITPKISSRFLNASEEEQVRQT
jgi:hypothetical protein